MADLSSIGPPAPSINPTIQQFGRRFQLLVSNNQGKTIDLSQFRCKFQVKKSIYQTPNVADIYVYNLASETAQFIKQEFTRVIMSAGYQGNYGNIFKGNIMQAIIGRENATDTFLNILCGDGDQAYNFAIINQTIGSNATGGVTQAQQLDAAINSMGSMGVGSGYVGTVPKIQLPRGKVMYGNARDYIKAVADTNGLDWSIQDENIVVVPSTQYLPTQGVYLSSKTGMIGTPQQTIEGIIVKCLLNPGLKCHSRVQIDNAAVAQMKIDFSTPGSPANTPVPILYDGYYFVMVVEHTGDNRGTEWYSNLRCLTIDPSSNPLNDGGVQPGYG
jgi:hypothetical protein